MFQQNSPHSNNYYKALTLKILVDLTAALDRTNREILRILQDDARAPFADIARQLGIGETTVRYRVKDLVDSQVITRMTALVDPRKIGMNITSIMMIKIRAKLMKKVFEQLAALEETHHLFQTTGEYDVIAVVHTGDTAHLNELKRKIKMIQGVTDILVWVATGLVKVETRFKL